MTTLISELYSAEPDVVSVYVRCTGAGTSNPTALTAKGVSSVTRSNLGKLTIVLSDKYQRLLAVAPIVIDPNTPDDWEVTVESDLATNNTIILGVWKGGAAADLSTDEKLLVRLDLARSAQKP